MGLWNKLKEWKENVNTAGHPEVLGQDEQVTTKQLEQALTVVPDDYERLKKLKEGLEKELEDFSVEELLERTKGKLKTEKQREGLWVNNGKKSPAAEYEKYKKEVLKNLLKQPEKNNSDGKTDSLNEYDETENTNSKGVKKGGFLSALTNLFSFSEPDPIVEEPEYLGFSAPVYPVDDDVNQGNPNDSNTLEKQILAKLCEQLSKENSGSVCPLTLKEYCKKKNLPNDLGEKIKPICQILQKNNNTGKGG